MNMMKKLFAIVLSLALLVCGTCVFTVKAAGTAEVTISGISSAPSAQAFYLTLEGDDLSYSEEHHWDYSYIDLTVTVDGRTLTRDEIGFKYINANERSVYFELRHMTLEPKVGTTITISGESPCYTANESSTVVSDSDTLRLTETFTLVYQGAETGWVSYNGDLPYTPMTIMGVASSEGDWAVYLQNDADTTFLSWNNLFADFTVTVNGVVLARDQFEFKHVEGGDVYFNIVNSPVALADDVIVTISGRSKSYAAGRASVDLNRNGIVLNKLFEMVYVEGAWVAQREANTAYSGKLSVEGIANSSNTSLVLKGNAGLDAYRIPVEGSWDYKAPANYGYLNGIFLNGTRVGGQILKNSNSGNMWYAEGFTANVGDILTIQGSFTDTTNAVRITCEKCMFRWDGTAWAKYIDYTLHTGSFSTAGAPSSNSATALYLKGSESLKGSFADGNWSERYQPMDGDENGIFVNNQKLEVQGNLGKIVHFGADDNYWYLDLSGVEVGTVVVIRGTFYNEANAAKVVIEDCRFRWNGSVWEDYTGAICNNVTITGISGFASQNGYWDIHLNVLAPNVTADWNVDYKDIQVYLDSTLLTDEMVDVKIVPGDASTMYLHLPASTAALLKPSSMLTVKAGKSDSYSDSVLDGITVTGDYTVEFNGSGWELPADYEQIGVTGVSSETVLNGSAWFVYFDLTAVLNSPAWDEGGAYSQKITVNGVSYTVTCKNAGDHLFMELPSAYLTDGATIVLKAGRYKSDEAYAYELTADFAMTYLDGGFINGALEKGELNIVGIGGSTNKQATLWHLYLTNSTAFVGNAWGAAYQQNVTVNGNAATLTVKNGGGTSMFVELPFSLVDGDGNYAVVFKAGTYYNVTDMCAYTIPSDFTLYVNKYGLSLDGFITPNAAVVPQFSLKDGGANAVDGLDLVIDRQDGAEHDAGWGLATYAYAGLTADSRTFYATENGFYLDGAPINWEAGKTGKMKKLGAQHYYLCLADVGVSAQVDYGTVLTVKGLFCDDNGYLVEFAPYSVYWNGTEWAEHLGDFSDSDTLYDVNADGEVNVEDAVLLVRWLANPISIAVSKAAADINGDDEITAEDQALLRRHLIGYDDPSPIVMLSSTPEVELSVCDLPKNDPIVKEDDEPTEE